jgi:hypothetical protein
MYELKRMDVQRSEQKSEQDNTCLIASGSEALVFNAAFQIDATIVFCGKTQALASRERLPRTFGGTLTVLGVATLEHAT